MRCLPLLLLVFLWPAATVQEFSWSDGVAAPMAGVRELTSQSFDAVVNGSAQAAVLFYIPHGTKRCLHCEAVAAVWAELGALVMGSPHRNELIIGKVNAEVEKAVAAFYEVTGLPTIKLFPTVSEGGGSAFIHTYEGDRTLPGVVQFLNAHGWRGLHVPWPATGGSVAVLSSDDFAEVVGNADADVLVNFYAPWCSHCRRQAPDFERVAAAFTPERPTLVVAALDADYHRELALAEGVSQYPTLKWYPKGSKGKVKQGVVVPWENASAMVAWVNQQTGACRTMEGLLTERAGRVAVLDDLACGFVRDKAARFAALKAAVAAVVKAGELTPTPCRRYMQGAPVVYLHVAERVLRKGDAYLPMEHARLSQLLLPAAVRASISTPARDRLALRKNVLSAFLCHPMPPG